MVSLKMRSISERDLNIKLTLIFTKIGQLDKAQEGIQELYELLLEYPECDVKVNAFLASAGTFFQNYLRKALDEITTRKMQACGMSPKPFNDIKPDFNSNSMNKKITPKFPSTSNRCSHSSIPSNNNTKILNNVNNHVDSSNGFNIPPLSSETNTLMSRVFMDKVIRETFDQTRSRLHGIFQYEKYKTGQKRSSLQEMHQFQTDSDRLEFAKSILQSKPRSRRATWMDSSSTTVLFSPPPERFSSIN